MSYADGGPTRTAVLRGRRSYADSGPARTAVLRGQRSYADSARGTRPSGLPSIACGRDGFARSSLLLRPAKRTAGRRGGCGKTFRM